MIKFFRHIRQNLLMENKTGKYLKYALGEIVLVVLGILIALQINTWNGEAENRKQEKLILKNLNFEFQKNKKNLSKSISQYHNLLKSTNNLMNLIGEDPQTLQTKNLDSLISESINYFDYGPTQYALSDLISSGNLRLISSDSLRLYLFEWSGFLNEEEESWRTLDQFSQDLMMPYLTKNASLKNIDSYGFLNWKQRSKLEVDNLAMFLDIEFENNLDNHMWAMTSYLASLENLEKVMDKIILETATYQ